MLATTKSDDQPNVLIYLAATGLVGMFVVLPTAAEFGKRCEPAAGPETAPGSTETSVSS